MSYHFRSTNPVAVKGYSLLPPPRWQAAKSADLAELRSACDALPLDRYAKSKNRRRALSYGHYLPRSGLISFDDPEIDPATGEPYTTYDQGKFNPEEAKRRFYSIPPIIQENIALRELITHDHTLLPIDENCTSIRLTIHLIRHEATIGNPGVSSPNLVHQDGVLCSTIRVLERSGPIIGGENFITRTSEVGKKVEEIDPRAILWRGIVDGDLSGYTILDRRIAHYVSPIETKEQEPAARTIVIIDFMPMIEADEF